VLYRLLWDYFKAYNEKYFKKICSKIIETFRPTSQNPFPLIVHFCDAISELKTNSMADIVPEYKMLPDPDDGGLTGQELEDWKKEVNEILQKNNLSI
jgi:hypothetical protein